MCPACLQEKPYIVKAGDVSHPQHNERGRLNILPTKFKDLELQSVSNQRGGTGGRAGLCRRARRGGIVSVRSSVPSTSHPRMPSSKQLDGLVGLCIAHS
jgi:hypothetical protein